MIFPPWLSVYGDQSYRGKCPLEAIEQTSFFNRLRREYHNSYGRIALHPRNEQLLEKGQFSALLKHKAEGMTTGAADVVIPGAVSFVCEIKRADHTKSHWQEGQQSYLAAAREAGAFVCVGLGAVGAWEAFAAWCSR